MKFCPTCQTRYDEEILRFCTKDGMPLIDEDQPSFTALPSETSDADDLGEETVIRRNPPRTAAAETQITSDSSERIVIPTAEAEKHEVRPPIIAARPEAPRRSNTAIVVLLTVLGTLAVLAGAGGVFWFLQRGQSADDANTNKTANINVNLAAENSNLNANFSTNLFSNINADANANFNADANTNANANANTKTPTPTPTRTPTPTPSPSASPGDDNGNTNINGNVNRANTNAADTPPATPLPSPRVSPSPTIPANVNVGVMNSRATSLPKPAYPSAARQVRASGQVAVAVTVDELGNVVAARAVSGHPLLRLPAEAAARQSRFNPVKIGDQAVRANGVLVYNFVNQ